MTSICGVVCNNCRDFSTKCAGCDETEGKVYRASYVGAEICPIYDCCVSKKQLKHCGKCEELPCQLYCDTQDSSMSIEEHKKGVIERAGILKEMR